MRRIAIPLFFALLVVLVACSARTHEPVTTSAGRTQDTTTAEPTLLSATYAEPIVNEPPPIPSGLSARPFPRLTPAPSPISDVSGRLESYEFSATNNRGETGVLGKSTWVGNWLPDNQTITAISYVNDPTYQGFERIATFNTATGEIQPYGTRRSMFIMRMSDWLDEAKMMSFVGANEPPSGSDINPPLHLWVTSLGTESLEKPALENVVASAGRGHTVIAMQREPRQLVEVNALTGESQILKYDVTSFGGDPSDGYLQMKWHPTLPLIAIFDNARFGLLNLEKNTFEFVKIDTDQARYSASTLWALDAIWNPEAPMLAIRAVHGDSIAEFYPELIILDAMSHSITRIEGIPGWVSGMTWAPNNTDMLVFVVDGDLHSERTATAYLLDTSTGTMALANGIQQASNFAPWDIAWSSDGSRLAVKQGMGVIEYNVSIP